MPESSVRRVSRGLSEQIIDRTREAQHDRVACEHFTSRHYSHIRAGKIDRDRFQFGIGDPYRAATGGQPSVDFFIYFAGAIAWRKNFDGEVRRARPEGLSRHFRRYVLLSYECDI